MTKQKNGGEKKRFWRIALPALVCAFFAVLLVYSAECASALREGLRLCARSVVPSLFPFMVLSGLLVRFGGTALISRLFSRVCGFFFGIYGEGSVVPVLGAVCGFPTGAFTAYNLYSSGKIGKNELERVLAFSNNPSPAFLISAVGISLFSSARFGTILYVSQLSAAFCVGVIFNVIFHTKKSENPNPVPNSEQSVRASAVFTETVGSSASAMINVCAFVLVFSALSGVLSVIFEKIGAGQTAKTVISGIFEMTCASAEAAKIIPREKGMVLAALVCGFSGFSVHFQIMSLCPSDDISFRPYFLAKIFQGTLSAFFVLAYIKIVGIPIAETTVSAFEPISEGTLPVFSLICDVLFAFGVFIFVLKKAKKRGKIN